MKKGNKNNILRAAKNAKKDEFYTQLSDIENELKHYKNYFNNKIVLCNCDNPNVSNFSRYFVDNFDKLKLKKIISIGLKNIGSSNFFVYDRDKYNNSAISFEQIEMKQLNGDGDFRSEESIHFLKEADIVVTNPPFSLFREYVQQLIDYDKKFIIIGHQNAITYKEIFSLIKNNKIWLGYGFKGNSAYFYSSYKDIAVANEHKKDMIRVSGVTWFTNLDIDNRKKEIVLRKKYNPAIYPKYDNYDAININKTADIPCDYDGIMGVPITFLNRYNPKQFEIIGFFNNYNPKTASIEKGQIYGNAVKIQTVNSLFRGPVVNGKAVYFRVLIKNKTI